MNAMPGFLEQINSVALRYEEMTHLLSDPEVIGDSQRYAALMKEFNSLTPLVECWKEFEKAAASHREAQELLEAGGLEKDFRQVVEEELESSRAAMEEKEQELKILLLPRDPNDGKNVIMEIRAGAGGEEAALFAASLCRMYTMYAQRLGWRWELLGASETELGGLKEVSFSIQGEGAYSRLKYESGVHRVQRVPETETQGRIHTSTVTVAVLPEAQEVEVQIDPKDLKIDTYRSGGAGGQHVNKTESAIRITHLPTGMVVECQDERSQYKNKDKAMRVLRSRLYERMQQEQEDQIARERRSQVGTGDRSERIRTYNFPQGRVSDHRIGLTLYKIDAIMDGDLAEITDALIAADQAEKLAGEHNG